MNYSALDDMQLLKLLPEKKEEAFAELYIRCWKRVYALALHFIKSPEAAQDVVEDVFVKIWTRAESLPGVCEFRPYQ